MSRVALRIESTRLPSRSMARLQIAPPALDLQIRFIDVPAPAHSAFAFAAHVLGHQRSKPLLPLPYRFVRELESTEEKHFSQIPQAELIPKAAEHDLEDDVGWQLEEVEGSAGSLIRLASTV